MRRGGGGGERDVLSIVRVGEGRIAWRGWGASVDGSGVEWLGCIVGVEGMIRGGVEGTGSVKPRFG